TASPAYKLAVTSGVNGSQAKFGGAGYLSSFDNQTSLSSNADLSTTASTARIDLNPQAGFLYLWSNTGLTSGSTFTPTNRMIIDSSGNVGIGSQITGTAQPNPLYVSVSTAANGGEIIHAETASGNIYQTLKSGTASF